MSDLAPTYAGIKVLQCIDAMKLIQEGHTVIDACEVAGISPRQYRYWIARGEDVLEKLRDVIVENERQELSIIATAKLRTTEKIAELLENSKNLHDMIEADKHLTMRQRELEERYGTNIDGGDVAGDFLLKGPKTTRRGSRFTVNISPQSDGSIDISVPDGRSVIDAEFSDG